MAADVFPDNAFARVGPHGGSDAHTAGLRREDDRVQHLLRPSEELTFGHLDTPDWLD